MNSLFARALAEADCKEQAEFFNEFFRWLQVICKSRHQNQICYIADFLDANGREFANALDQFAKLALNTRAKTEQEISNLYLQRQGLQEEIATIRERRDKEWK